MSNQNSIIRPQTAAAKTAALKNMQAPAFAAAVAKESRLIELLWFIQWISLQPGGLVQFVKDFLRLFGDSIGTKPMRRIGKTTEAYTAAERQEVIASFPSYHSQKFDQRAADIEADNFLDSFTTKMGAKPCPWPLTLKKPDLAFVNKQNFEFFRAACQEFALLCLPTMLMDFSAEPDYCLPADAWFFDGLTGALLEMLDAHAGRASGEIVMTEVASQSHDALEFAWTEKAMVEIIGDSRFGKTESVKAWCAMYPGRARMVKTPCDNCDRSLLEAFAEALGVELSLKLTVRELKATVEFCLKHCGLMFVFDEAAWLIPQRYSPKTAPMRLNYIRSQVLENGCPVALIQTPQFFGPAAQKFERATGFNMAQWKGRIMRTVQLPSELPERDLAAVVNHHFPELDAACVTRVIACALVSDSYLFAVLKIAKNARAVARKNGREKIQLADLEAGITLAGIVIPQSAAIAPAPAGRKNPIASKRGRNAAQAIPALECEALQAPSREAQPLITT